MADRGDGVTSACWLLCQAGTRLCALPLAQIIETMRVLPVEALPVEALPVEALADTALPDAPRFVIGVSVIRGEPVPVVDAAALFGEAIAPRQRLVACDVGDRRVALAVDRVPGFLDNAPAASLPPLLRDAAADAVQALRICDGELLLLLDAARLISEAVLPPAMPVGR